jgi:prefoldin alpha subunit
MSGNQEMQQLSQELQALEEEQEALEGNAEMLREEKRSVDEAIDAVGSLDTGTTVQVPLGGGAYVRATIEDIDEIIVELGGGYAAEQPEGDAVETLESRKDTIDDRISDVQSEIAEVETELEELEQRARQLQQQQMQQQMQQLQQQDDE